MPTIIFDKTGQTIVHVPPAKVTSPSYVLKNDDEEFAAGNATESSLSITSTGAAGADQRNSARIPATSTTGAVIGAACSIVAPDGSRETFRIKSFYANSYIEAETGLAGTYPSGSIVYGIELSVTVPDDLAADEALVARDDLRIVWTYTLNGVVYRPSEPIIFARYTSSVDASIGKAVIAIQTEYSDMPGRLAEGTDLGKLVASMAERVANDLRGHGLEPEYYMLGPHGCDLLVARTLWHASKHGYAPGATLRDRGTGEDRKWREECKAEYYALLAKVVAEPPAEGVEGVDPETDQAVDLAAAPTYSAIVDTATLQGLHHLRRW